MDRQEAQKLAKEKGHCLCSKLFTCPCRVFKDKDFCKCANEGDMNYQEWLEYNQNEVPHIKSKDRF